MFGLLGGLLGGGLLGGMGGGKGGSSMPKYAARAPQSVAPPPAPEAGAPPAAATPAAEPAPQPAEKALSQIAPEQVSQGQPKSNPVSGLLDAPDPVASPPQIRDEPAMPEQVANRSETSAPTAPQAEDAFGAIPMLRKTDLLKNQLLDAKDTRIQMPFQSGMPDKHFDTSGSDWTPPMGLSYQQSSTIDQMPPRKYGR